MPDTPVERLAPASAADTSHAEEWGCSAFDAAAVAMRLEDLTELARAMDDLRARGVSDLRKAIADDPELVGRLMRTIDVLDVNRQCIALYEASSKAELMANWSRAVLPETMQCVKQAMVALFEGRRDFQAPTVIRTLRGERRNVVVAIRFPAPDKPFDRVFQSMIDVTEQTQAEAAREVVEARYHQAVESSPIGVFISNETGGIEHANPAMYRMFGRTPRELEGSSFRELTHPDDIQRSEVVVERLAADPTRTVMLRKRYLRKDGSILWGQIFLSRLPEASDGRIRILGYIIDITKQVEAEEEQQRLEDKVRRANMLESLGVLAGGVAHDFNNLLVGVMGHAGIARGKLPTDAPVQSNLQQIELAASRAAELTNQMLAYSGGGRFVLTHARLGDIVHDMRNLLDVAVPSNVEWRTESRNPEVDVHVDLSQMRQVVMNLVTNAAESFDAAGGRLKIETGAVDADEAYLRWLYLDDGLEPGRYAYLEVSDTGCGIEPEILEHVFDPFFTTKTLGRGLGLAAVLGIVRGHGGGIRIESTPGGGTTARVLFPADQAPESAPAPDTNDTAENGTTDGTGPLRILLADDKPLVLDVARQMLECDGHKVDLAIDGKEALDLFEERRHDVVILDLTMPRMSGAEACRRIRKLDPDVPVIFSSGHAQEAVLNELGDAHTSHFVRKPYRVADLLDTVAQAIAKA
ncbi:MAG: response regulator [Planctomycetota bacterium]|nr:response regulator [Planctomycetota bacterium]